MHFDCNCVMCKSEIIDDEQLEKRLYIFLFSSVWFLEKKKLFYKKNETFILSRANYIIFLSWLFIALYPSIYLHIKYVKYTSIVQLSYIELVQLIVWNLYSEWHLDARRYSPF